MRHESPAGTTLIELLIVLSIIGIIATVATLAIPRPRPANAGDPAVALAQARRRAMTTGRDTTIVLIVGDSAYEATAHPDGTIVADNALHVERLTGAINVAR